MECMLKWLGSIDLFCLVCLFWVLFCKYGKSHNAKVLLFYDLLRITNLEQFCLPVDLYTNLSTPQILKLEFRHNELLEHSKKMTFQEKVKFYAKTNIGHPNASPRVWCSLWRGRLPTLTNRSVSTFV